MAIVTTTSKPRSKSESARAPAARRAVIVDGARTPFTRAWAEFLELDTIALAGHAVRALLNKTEVPRKDVDAIVWGGVILVSSAPNTAREVALDLNLPRTVHGMTVTRACASGLQAITTAVDMIERGHADVVIAGGSDSTSNAEVPMPRKLVHAGAKWTYGKDHSMGHALQLLSQLQPITDILPKAPKIAERSTGRTMGQHAEEMAQRNGVTRQSQDELAVRSHKRAAAAIASGVYGDEVSPVEAGSRKVYQDTIVRADTSVEAMSKLRPVFSKTGTLTAANSSPLTDGAACVLLMSEEKAKALGYKPLAAFRSWAYVGIDPFEQLLLGPAFAMPLALKRAGLTLKDMDVVDIHEAFAAQVLSNLKMMASESFCVSRLGWSGPVGEVDPDKLNVHGGSIAIGHPFAATGARMVTTMAKELQRRDGQFAWLGICAAGGLGAGAVLERV
ncbi:MAG: 3-ketoacyl-CoA thiolase FadI [Myxococcota bacterium]|nr:3-ketoacyl-CoA thiolase FadI [Myxococcota bacterium]